MLTGQLRSQIDRIWDAFWSGGISNPLEVIEQITYLLFLRRLDDLQILEENKAARLDQPIERRIFPEGNDPGGRPYDDLRWSRFKNMSPAEMYAVVGESVFPFLRTLGADESTYALSADVTRLNVRLILTSAATAASRTACWTSGRRERRMSVGLEGIICRASASKWSSTSTVGRPSPSSPTSLERKGPSTARAGSNG